MFSIVRQNLDSEISLASSFPRHLPTWTSTERYLFTRPTPSTLLIQDLPRHKVGCTCLVRFCLPELDGSYLAIHSFPSSSLDSVCCQPISRRTFKKKGRSYRARPLDRRPSTVFPGTEVFARDLVVRVWFADLQKVETTTFPSHRLASQVTGHLPTFVLRHSPSPSPPCTARPSPSLLHSN